MAYINTPVEKWVHVYMLPDVSWQSTLNLAKAEEQYAPPTTLVSVHKHEVLEPCNEKCRLLTKSVEFKEKEETSE